MVMRPTTSLNIGPPVVNSLSALLTWPLASVRTQEREERLLKLRRHGCRRRITQDARRRQVRGNEGVALRASSHVRAENRAQILGHHAFQVVHQKLDAGLTGDLRHDFTPGS